MPGTQYEGGRTYLSIVGGKIRHKVTEDTEGAVLRKWETPTGEKGEKWELVYESWNGLIKDIRVNETEYGKFLEVKFDDATLSIHTDSRYFSDFVKKLASADLTKPIVIRPYDFEDDKKQKVVGVTLTQLGEKLTDHFYDFSTKTYKFDFPKAAHTKTTPYDKDDWKAYFLGVKKFLLAYVAMNIAPKLEGVKEEEEPKLPEMPEKEEVKLEDVPF